MKNIIKTLSGQVNLLKQSAKVCIFHAPRRGSKGHSEVYLDKASTSGVTGGEDGVVTRIGFPTPFPSVPGCSTEVAGQMFMQSFGIEEGEVIKVFVTCRRGWGKLPLVGSVFLRARKDAAYRKVSFVMIDHPDVAFRESTVEGNLDILTLKDVLALGVHVPVPYRPMAEQHVVDRLITKDLIVEPEHCAPIKYTDKVISDGTTVKTITVRKRRRVIE